MIITGCLILVVIVYWRIYIILKRHKNLIEELQIQEVQQGVQNGDFFVSFKRILHEKFIYSDDNAIEFLESGSLNFFCN